MKRMKVTIPTRVFVFLALLTLGCAETGKRDSGAEDSQTTVQAPKQLISIETARNHYDTYSRRRAPLIQQYEDSVLASEGLDSTFAVARYVTFDYQTLKNYLAYIEQEAEKVETDISSLRIYLANNPEEGSYIHPRQNSVFLIPAAKDARGDGLEYGLYIDGSQPGFLSGDLRDPASGTGTGNESGVPSEASLLPVSAAAAQEKQSLILNFGGSAPPPYQ